MLIDIRCKHCRRLLGRVSKNFFGVIVLHCRECKQTQEFSQADLIKVTKSLSPT